MIDLIKTLLKPVVDWLKIFNAKHPHIAMGTAILIALAMAIIELRRICDDSENKLLHSHETIIQQPTTIEVEIKDSANIDVINQQNGGIGNTQNNNTIIYK
jgi:hypothetical protein